MLSNVDCKSPGVIEMPRSLVSCSHSPCGNVTLCCSVLCVAYLCHCAVELRQRVNGRPKAVDQHKKDCNAQANRKKLAQERDDYLATQAAIDKENAKLAADEAAKRRTGITSRDELNKAIEAENKAAEQGVGRAGEFRGQATGTEAGIQRSNQLFNLRQAAGSMGALAQVEAERTKQREEAEKERERAAKEAEREAGRRATNLKQVGSTGGSLASTLAGDGLAPGFADSLRAAAGGAGDAAGLDRLIAMVAKLTANSSKLSEQAKSKLDKLEAEIEDLRTAK
jgi:hypothetical protein